MKAHLANYAEAYCKALLYILLQYALAIVSITGPGAGDYDHLLYFARLSTLALPAVLAFLDGSVERGRDKATALAIREVRIEPVAGPRPGAAS